ncbi:hypothetical protein [Catellatospora sp. NPDC049609]|uniref:hypothetical protein n=1 Tax=Catellatospora sp. NPDC049609 TaxID=3155505 RepID=UPI00341D6A63
MSWADMSPRKDVSRHAGAAEQGHVDFDSDFADLRHRARHLIAEIVRLSRQLADLQKTIRSRPGHAGRSRDGASATE